MTHAKLADADLRFNACLAFTLKYEGGRSNDPRDPGGRTMEGVTQATYDSFRDHGKVARRSVFAMSAAERDEIYRTRYWNAINGDDLRPGEDLCVFDFAVNSGPARARAIWKSCGGSNRLPADVVHDICAHRLSFLRALRTWKYFGRGWGRRVAACEALATSMVHGKAAPAVLPKKASEAKHRSGKASTMATVGASVAGSAGIAHYMATGSTVAAIAAAVIVLLGGGIFFFQSWRHGQRADALINAASKQKEEHAELAQKTETIKQAQQAATAKVAIADLESKPPAVTKAKKGSAK
ncbi:MAG: glycoside hydrolase family 108 protein [Methylocella sp.]